LSVDVGQVRDCLVAGWDKKMWDGVLSGRLREKNQRKQRLEDVYEWRLEKLGDRNPKAGEAATVSGPLFFCQKRGGPQLLGEEKLGYF
jgi:hypothetical protein